MRTAEKQGHAIAVVQWLLICLVAVESTATLCIVIRIADYLGMW